MDSSALNSPADVAAIDDTGAADLRRLVSLAALVVSNLLPVAGVLYWGWDVGMLVVLYWSENLIIGAYTLVKVFAQSPFVGLFAGPFFLIHYGGFCAVHGIFVLELAVQHEFRLFEGGETWPLFLAFVQLLIAVVREVFSIAPPEWVFGFAALTVSHGISLWLHHFKGGEHRHHTTRSLMVAPYKRIVILHVAIIAGGFAVVALGAPLGLLLLLVALKLVVDLWLHAREHRPRAVRAAAAT